MDKPSSIPSIHRFLPQKRKEKEKARNPGSLSCLCLTQPSEPPWTDRHCENTHPPHTQHLQPPDTIHTHIPLYTQYLPPPDNPHTKSIPNRETTTQPTQSCAHTSTRPHSQTCICTLSLMGTQAHERARTHGNTHPGARTRRGAHARQAGAPSRAGRREG